MAVSLGRAWPFLGLGGREARPAAATHIPISEPIPVTPSTATTIAASVDGEEVDLRDEVLRDIARVQTVLLAIYEHERGCAACGPECADWLRDQWAEVRSLLEYLPIESLSLARGEHLTLLKN